MNIIQMICSDNFIAVNKTLIKEFGIEPAILLGELASELTYWEKQELTQDGYFYSTIENVEERTTLTAYQQRKALTLLEEKGVVNVISKKGAPPKRYIRINETKLVEYFDFQKSNILTSKSENISLSKVKKLDTKNKETKKKSEEEFISEAIAKTNFQTEEFRTALVDFLEMRKTLRKPVTSRAIGMLIKKACEYANNDEGIVVEIFNQSTRNSWLGVYPLKNNYSYSGRKPVKNPFMEMLEQMEVSESGEKGSCADIGIIANCIPEHTDRQ